MHKPDHVGGGPKIDKLGVVKRAEFGRFAARDTDRLQRRIGIVEHDVIHALERIHHMPGPAQIHQPQIKDLVVGDDLGIKGHKTIDDGAAQRGPVHRGIAGQGVQCAEIIPPVAGNQFRAGDGVFAIRRNRPVDLKRTHQARVEADQVKLIDPGLVGDGLQRLV